MGQIYSNAKQTIVWLGGAHQLLDDFKWALTVFGHAVGRLYDTKGETYFATKQTSSALLDQRLWQELGLPALAGLRHLTGAMLYSAACRWFNRSWIVQEYTLANDLCILAGTTFLASQDLVRLGRLFSTPWGSVFSALRYMSAIGDALVDESLQVPDWVIEDAVSLCYRFFVLDSSREVQKRFDHGTFLEWPLNYKRVSNDTQAVFTNFMDQIRVSRSTVCSDMRDKVYSLVGLLGSHLAKQGLNIETYIHVDYEKSTAVDVYRDAQVALINNLDSLAALSLVEGKGDISAENLPSWIPDLRAPHGILHIEGLTNCTVWGSAFSYDTRAQVCGLQLAVRGVRIERMCRVMPEFTARNLLSMALPELYGSPPESRARILQETLRWHVPESVEISDEERVDLAEKLKKSFCAFLITELASEITNSQPDSDLDMITNALQETLEPFEAEIKSAEIPSVEMVLRFINNTKLSTQSKLTPIDKTEVEKAQLYISRTFQHRLLTEHRLKYTTDFRMVFRTTRGVLGICPRSSHIGDEVWMLEGSDVPVILRWLEGVQYNRYRLIGECYLHGYMKGEKLVEEPDLKDRVVAIRLL
jgi:hypothetical protein